MLRSHRLTCATKAIAKLSNLLGANFTRNTKLSVLSKRSMCTTKAIPIQHDTIDLSEVEKFHKAASEWWKPDGCFYALLSLNALRVPFVRDGLLSNVDKKQVRRERPLDGFRIVDIGCGGGFFCEPLARLGACVTGIDPSSENIRIATTHASFDPALKDRLTYTCGTVEGSVGTIEPVDALVCSEVIEHVDNPDVFVECCVNLVKEGGSLFFTTINKTSLSYFIGILAAEYVLGVIPKGSHDWNKFIPPVNLENMLEHQSCQTQVIHGMLYNPFTDCWSWSNSTSIHYALHAFKCPSN